MGSGGAGAAELQPRLPQVACPAGTQVWPVSCSGDLGGGFNASLYYDMPKVAGSRPGWPGETCLGVNRTVPGDG